MLGVWLFQRYLNKLDDYNFTERWEKKILPRQRFYWLGALIYFFVAVGVITEILTYGSESLFFNLVIILFTAAIYGGYFIRNILRFLAVNNQRYLQIKTGFYNDTFSKDNVVG